MKCPHCGYEGRGRTIYFSALSQNMNECVKCGEISTIDELPQIKGFCGDCDLLEDNDLGIYCGKSLEDVNPVKDYCSFWEAKDDIIKKA